MREVCKPAMILKKYFPISFARITLTAQTVPALIKVKTVCPGGAATGSAGKAGASSDEKRIRRFPGDFPTDTDAFTRSAGAELPEGRRIPTTDRTYREFGKLRIDIPMPAVAYEGVAVPSLRKFPGEPDTGKKGSSDTGERTGLMSRFIRLSGAGRIAELCADRESVGGERFGRLHSRGIRISVRVRGNRCITDSEGTAVRGSVLFREPKSGGSRIPGGRRKTGDVGVHIGGMRLPDGEFPTAAGSGNPGESHPELMHRGGRPGRCLPVRKQKAPDSGTPI
ncbi:MAG: hypothetical protein HC887_05590 [Desulfobacteraceae bacterium]|nr:hypothetical protein [Desulfobacteraceae bacterium]